MKEVNCVVCGVPVSKRQSLAYVKDGQAGRACRTHPEVQIETQKRLAEEEKKRLDEIQRRKRQVRSGYIGTGTFQHHVPTGPECWSCQKPGIYAREHWLRMMIATEKCLLKKKSVLDPMALREEYGEQKLVLVLTPVPEKHPLVWNHPELATMRLMSLGSLCICQECAKRNGLVEEWQKALSPEISPEVMKNWMSIAPLLPEFQIGKEIARLEVIAEQQVTVVGGEQPLPSESK